MGPQGKGRYGDYDHLMTVKERAMQSGSGSVSGSPGRMHDNISRDSGIGGVKDGGLNTSNDSDHDIPKFISDGNDKTNYVRGKFLGKGGFARVHELIDLNTSAVLAGKIIHKSRISKPHHKEKITREIELHRSLKHRNVVEFIKNFEDPDNIYILLENCARKSLVHVLKCRQVVTEPETRYYMSQLVHGVDYIHNQNIIHRDLKLGNLFLTNKMDIKIGDFGLATRLGQEKKGTICGTPNYISPEVLNKEGHGFQADIWALGCVMYALLVGQPPFETSTLKETYSRIADNHYTVPDTISTSATQLIKRLLHPMPKSRPNIQNIPQDSFFSSGFHPTTLPTSCCTQPPVFPTQPLVFPNNPDISSLTSSVLSLSLPDPHQPHYRSNNNIQQQQQAQQAQQHHHHHQQQQQHHHQQLDNCHTNAVKKPKLKTRTSALHEALCSALTSMPARPDSTLQPIKSDSTVFITKWIDYSNKYGFGFQLSDRSVGVLFNDNTRISYSFDRSYIQFAEGSSVSTMSTQHVPTSLHEKFTLLRYFAQYMDENLTEGGEAGNGRVKPCPRAMATPIPQIKRWIRTPKAIIMHLTNGTIQVNYFKDHTKMIVGGERSYTVTYINCDRQARAWHLQDLARRGASPSVRERMGYVASVLEEFSELDDQIKI